MKRTYSYYRAFDPGKQGVQPIPMFENDGEGTVYLLHFDRPYRHARHYLGWALHLEDRLKKHGTPEGARLMEVVAEDHIGWVVARLWSGSRELEVQLKRRHSGVRLCPICIQQRIAAEMFPTPLATLYATENDLLRVQPF